MIIRAVTGSIKITNEADLTKQYDGNPPVEPTYEQSRPGNVRIEYYKGADLTGEKLSEAPIDSGTYTVKVILEAYEGYLETFDAATFKITKIPSSIEILNKESLNKQYDGEEVNVEYKTSREGTVTVTYINASTGETLQQVPKAVGRYSVTVTLAEELNYEGATATASYEITKIPTTTAKDKK